MGALNGKFVKISYKMSDMEKRQTNTNNNNDNLSDDCEDSKSNISSGNGNTNTNDSGPSTSTSGSWRCSSNASASSSSGENNNPITTCTNKGGSCINSTSTDKKVTQKKKKLLKSSSAGAGTSSSSGSSSIANTIASKKENFFSKRNKKWPMRSASSKKEQETESKSSSSSCICTSYRRTNSDTEASLNPRNNTGPFHHGPIIDLSKFNPHHYPIEDEDERQRQLRAKEIQEGVELSAVLFGNLKLKERDECSGTNTLPVHTQVDYIHCLVPDLKEISNCSFYHGKIDRYAAESLLDGKPEGTFLLRDSAQEDFLFSVSFRRYGRSLHARIEQWNHKFSFDSHDPSVFCSQTVTGLIHHYKEPSVCMFFEPMLTVPLHRNNPFNLQHLARSVISSNITYDDINLLPIPKKLKTYCKEYHYKQRVCIRRLD